MNSGSIFELQVDVPNLQPKEQLLGQRAREFELILRCVRTQSPIETSLHRIQDIFEQPLDWDFILNFLRYQGLVAPFFLAIKRLDSAAVPERILETIKSELWERTKWNLNNAVVLLKILQCFEAHGIDAVPFKGPALAAMIYKDLRLRSSCDLDIIVRQKDLAQAEQLLISEGFALEKKAVAGQWDNVSLERKDRGFRRNDGIRVELHWRVLPRSMPFLPDMEYLWNNLTTVPFLNSHVLQFPPETLLVLLCVHHGVSHIYESIHWVCDIDRFLGAYSELDWDQVFTLANRGDCLRAVLLGCRLAQMLMGTELPEPIAAQLKKDPCVQRLADSVIRWRLKQGLRRIGLWKTLFFYSRIKSNWKSRLHLANRLILTPKRVDREFVPLPPALDFLYIPLRPLRLLAGALIGRSLK